MANPKNKKRRKIIVFSTIGLVLAGLTLAAIFRKREPVITVQTEKVARRNITETVVANGKIQPVLQVKISPEVSGEIIELPVKEGQSVKKGDLLVKIKPDSYIANVKSAEAQYLSSASGKDLAQATMRKAELEFKRNEELLLGKLESESTFLEFKTGFEVAQAQYESATHQVAVAKAALDRAREELAKTTISGTRPGHGGTGEDNHLFAAGRHDQQVEFPFGRTRGWHSDDDWHGDHDCLRFERHGSAH